MTHKIVIEDFTTKEMLALFIAGRAMELSYEKVGIMTEEACVELKKACDKLERMLWSEDANKD